MIFVVETFET